MTVVQTPSLILPTSYAAGTGTLASTETIADALEHTSIEVNVTHLQEKSIHVMATEIALAPAAIPDPLIIWVEVSPYPTANALIWPSPLPTSANFWAAIGGGGGALPPVAPLPVVTGLGGAAGVLAHGVILPWNITHPWCRVVVQTPAPLAGPPNAYWIVQVILSGKTA
jgi:hypothetical protein